MISQRMDGVLRTVFFDHRYDKYFTGTKIQLFTKLSSRSVYTGVAGMAVTSASYEMPLRF